MPELTIKTKKKIGTSLTLPVKSGKPILGTWQKIVLIELDGPRERRVVLSSI